MTKFTIEKVNNGFIIRDYIYVDDNEDGSPKFEENVEVIETESLDDKEELEKMLSIIAEKLGYQYDKWSEENLNIQFNKKGHKLED